MTIAQFNLYMDAVARERLRELRLELMAARAGMAVDNAFRQIMQKLPD